ncbi:MAG: GFA family protein [Betaproteobacteria bacterium]|nr:GFA family protein [Betaproteobacteria bacterium]
MQLKGSCHCGAVRFSLESETPYPYMHCYCSICRKTAGGGGYAINIMGLARTVKKRGRSRVYRATRGGGERHFCPKCGSALWVWDRRWPEWIYPFASAIDTPLPVPKERQHVLLGSKANWISVPKGRRDKRFREYPREAIVDRHRKRGLMR